MRQDWLHQRGGPDCLVFCAGFGMDPEPFRDIACRGHDLLMLWDWRDLRGFDPAPLRKKYRRLRLLAWSMGVLAAARLLAAHPTELNGACAINGTLRPIDAGAGIDPRRYRETQGALNEAVLEQFHRNMFDSEAAAAHFLARRPRRDIPQLREELAALWQLALESPPPPDPFSTVVAGLRDRVIPPRNQQRAWGRSRCRLLPLPHFFLRLSPDAAGWPDWDGLARDLLREPTHEPA